jgi:hypothetical protein
MSNQSHPTQAKENLLGGIFLCPQARPLRPFLDRTVGAYTTKGSPFARARP